jgi:hypothetical protein
VPRTCEACAPRAGQPQGIGPEVSPFKRSQGSKTEDARKDGPIRGRSRWFVHNAGQASLDRPVAIKV